MRFFPLCSLPVYMLHTVVACPHHDITSQASQDNLYLSVVDERESVTCVHRYRKDDILLAVRYFSSYTMLGRYIVKDLFHQVTQHIQRDYLQRILLRVLDGYVLLVNVGLMSNLSLSNPTSPFENQNALMEVADSKYSQNVMRVIYATHLH